MKLPSQNSWNAWNLSVNPSAIIDAATSVTPVGSAADSAIFAKVLRVLQDSTQKVGVV